MSSVEVTVLGKRLVIRSDDDEDYVREVAAFVNKRMEEVQRAAQGAATLNVAILAAMNIADDFFKAEGRTRALSDDVAARVDQILEFIDEKLGST